MDRIGRSRHEAQVWLNAEFVKALGDELPRVTRVRLAAMKDRRKAERVRGNAIRIAASKLSQERRDEMYEEIVASMPRRLRRALGERSYSQAGAKMSIPGTRR